MTLDPKQIARGLGASPATSRGKGIARMLGARIEEQTPIAYRDCLIWISPFIEGIAYTVVRQGDERTLMWDCGFIADEAAEQAAKAWIDRRIEQRESEVSE